MSDSPFAIREIEIPDLLGEIADPPDQLYARGPVPSYDEYRFLCVVGSRKYTPYGKRVCQKLISGLRGYPVVIVSGLALGIDAIAHKAALGAGLLTLSVPGSGLGKEVLYPRSNVPLARKILTSGGALVSEFEPDFKATSWGFPKRNRIMAGLSHAVLVVEATEKSGTLITSRLATEYNREVCTIPGSIDSDNSAGPHQLIRNGATPVTKPEHILEVLRISVNEDRSSDAAVNLSDEETAVFQALTTPLAKDELIDELSLPTSKAQILLSKMELKGLIEEKLGKVFKKE